MREREPTTQTMKASRARQEWGQVLNKVYRKQTRVLVEKSGIPVAAIVSADDLERLTRLDQERAQRFKILDNIGERFKDESPEEIERQVARAVAQVRAENRRRAPRRA
jgi:prevent-host-death family protein